MPSQFFVKRVYFTTVCSCVCITFNLVWLAFARVKPKKWICFVAVAVPLFKMVITSFSLPAICCYLNCCYLLASVVLDLLFIVCVQTCTLSMPSAVFTWSMYWESNFLVYYSYLYIVPDLNFLKLSFVDFDCLSATVVKHSVDLDSIPVVIQLKYYRNYNRLITFFHKEDQLDFLIWETIIIMLKVFVHS